MKLIVGFTILGLMGCALKQKISDRPFNFEPLCIEGSDSSFFQDPNNLVVIFPAHLFGNKKSGYSFAAKLIPSLEKTISYEVKFPLNFDFVKGCKLPGLCGGKKASGGNPATGSNGFSARLIWRKDGRLVSYVYHVGQKDQYGDDFKWAIADDQPLFIQKGIWHKIKVTVRMNSIGKSDGSIVGYFDDQKVFVKSEFVFRTTDTISIDRVCFNTFYGGDDSSWAPTKEERLYLRNLVVF